MYLNRDDLNALFCSYYAYSFFYEKREKTDGIVQQQQQQQHMIRTE